VNAAPDVDVIIVGAGVVGLAIARALALRGREAWVLESEARAGEGISSRNSGVIHAGFYYPPGSAKARLCCRGRELLYAYCAARGIPHRRTGKLLVATADAQLVALRELLERGEANGVPGLRWLDGAEARALEPALACVAAVESPESGIVEVPELVMALVGEAESRGGRVLCNTEVAAVRRLEGGFRVETVDAGAIGCRALVNAAGLGATALAARIEGLPASCIPRMYYAAGHYYTIRGPASFGRLIYPLPEPAGLGIHLGVDIAGRTRLGPDVRWIERIDYSFDDSQHARFVASTRRWWPALEPTDLQPDFVGVRPKLSGPGAANGDFMLQYDDSHGVARLVNLFGIESPGLTSCLAIGEEVAARLA
jgi:L-2-hydroxyglutarate oxidase LhgO